MMSMLKRNRETAEIIASGGLYSSTVQDLAKAYLLQTSISALAIESGTVDASMKGHYEGPFTYTSSHDPAIDIGERYSIRCKFIYGEGKERECIFAETWSEDRAKYLCMLLNMNVDTKTEGTLEPAELLKALVEKLEAKPKPKPKPKAKRHEPEYKKNRYFKIIRKYYSFDEVGDILNGIVQHGHPRLAQCINPKAEDKSYRYNYVIGDMVEEITEEELVKKMFEEAAGAITVKPTWEDMKY